MEGYYDIVGEPICDSEWFIYIFLECSYKCKSCKDTNDYCLDCPSNSGRELGSDNSCSCTEEYYDEIENPLCKCI